MSINPEILELLEKKVYDLKSLINIGMSLSSNLNFETLVESILYSCIGQVVVERVAILLQVDIDSPDLYIHMAKGYDSLFDQEVILEEKSPIRLFFEDNPSPIFIEQLAAMDFGPDLERLKILSPSLIVPMKSKNSLNGILVLGSKISGDAFTDTEKEFMQSLSKFAAIAVENSRLYKMATLDRMTRLYIHHYFQERLIEEIGRSKRSGLPVSLIIADLDHFKDFNDTYGHLQGDVILKRTAQEIKNNIRGIDIAARYGGEEFAVILPGAGLQEAVIVANRLRSTIERSEYPGQKNPLRVTTSFGIAQFDPARDKNSLDLIKRADTALYRAKENGRNRVEASE